MRTIFSNPLGFQYNKTDVYMVFGSKKKASAAIQPLQKKGFAGDEILLFVSHQGSLLDFGTQGTTKMPEDLIVGTMFGAALGCLATFLYGSFIFRSITSNPLLLGMLGLAVGAMLGSPVGAIIGLAFRRFNLKLYETWLREGRILVLVEAKDEWRASQAKIVLQIHGGHSMNLSSIVKKVA